MTLPPDWYKEAFERIDNASGGRRVAHAFRTNAIAMTDRWIRLLRDHNVRTCVSIDGPEDLHDTYRRTRGGRGSRAVSLRDAARLSETGLPFHLISVLTADSLVQPEHFSISTLRMVSGTSVSTSGNRRARVRSPALKVREPRPPVAFSSTGFCPYRCGGRALCLPGT